MRLGSKVDEAIDTLDCSITEFGLFNAYTMIRKEWMLQHSKFRLRQRA